MLQFIYIDDLKEFDSYRLLNVWSPVSENSQEELRLEEVLQLGQDLRFQKTIKISLSVCLCLSLFLLLLSASRLLYQFVSTNILFQCMSSYLLPCPHHVQHGLQPSGNQSPKVSVFFYKLHFFQSLVSEIERNWRARFDSQEALKC